MESSLDFKRGAFVFTGSHSPISQIIRRVQGFKYSHVSFCLSHEFLIEAEWNGVIQSCITKYSSGEYWVETIQMKETSDFINEYCDDVLKLVGAPYDFPQCFGILLSRMFHRPRSLSALFDSPSRFICSEMFAKKLLEKGKQLKYPAAQYVVKDLYLLLKELYE